MMFEEDYVNLKIKPECSEFFTSCFSKKKKNKKEKLQNVSVTSD